MKEMEIVKKAKIATGAVLAIILVAGLYWINRYWIAPAVKSQAASGGDHPLAPDFSLTDISGNKISLSNYKGKVVLLDFWATWCGPCRFEIPAFVELQNRYGSQGLAVVGISMDDGPDPVVEFYRQDKMNYPVALGSERLGEQYGGILGLPTTFLIGRDGRVYAKHVGATDPAVFEDEVKKLLSASADGEARNFHQQGPIPTADQIEMGNPAEIDSEVPGVDLTKLTAAQKEQFKKLLAGKQCTCGCGFDLLKCRQVDRACGVSRKMAREELDNFLKSHV